VRTHLQYTFYFPPQPCGKSSRLAHWICRVTKFGVFFDGVWVSIQSLAWHLRNVLGVSESDRKRIASIESPFKIAVRMGLIDRVQQEFNAKGVTRWPRNYVRLALKGFESGKVSRPELARLLEDQQLTTELERLLTAAQ